MSPRRQSDGNEKRARINGAHYYASKPLSLERFGYVLRSFLQLHILKGATLMKSIVWFGALLALLGILGLAIPVFTTVRNQGRSEIGRA